MIELFHIILKKVHQKGPLRKIKWIKKIVQQILNIHGQLPLFMSYYWNWWKYVPGRFLLHENNSMAKDKPVINSPSFEGKKRILRFHAWDCNRLPQGLLELQVYWSTSSTQNIHIPDCCYIFNSYKWQRNNFSLQYHSNFTQTIDENKENISEGLSVIQYHILRSNITRIV